MDRTTIVGAASGLLDEVGLGGPDGPGAFEDGLTLLLDGIAAGHGGSTRSV